jgi:cell wall-associated NlpC family hydrolase
MRRVLVAAVVALAVVPQAFGGIAEVRDAHGRLIANGGAGAFGSLNDAGWTLRYDSASSSPGGVLLRGVSLVGGLVYADRVFVPADGLRGARVSGLVVNGHAVRAAPNTLVPLGPGSYLVVLQEAVVPGEGSGVVGLRVVAGDSSLGLDPGTQLLVGLARAAQTTTVHTQARLSWLSLGISGHAPTLEGAAFPELAPIPTNGTLGGKAIAIAERYLGVPYRWGGADPLTGFDCSGFTMYVYAQVGVSLPHNAAAQYGYGSPVSRSQLAPGDLVFFDGLGHVGLYIGGGQFIHAPHTGDVVKISSLTGWYASTYVGARRL